MRNAQAIIKFALEEAGVEDSAKIARKTLKRMAAHRGLIIAWLCEVGGLEFVGYTSSRVPKHIYPLPMTRGNSHVYIADGGDDDIPKVVGR